VPTSAVSRVDQTYHRLDRRRWRSSDPKHGAFELSVDGAGLLVDYEGFASRLS